MEYIKDIDQYSKLVYELEILWSKLYDFEKTSTFTLLNNKDKREFKKIENKLFILMKDYKYKENDMLQ